jgi:hypothetical protein
MPVTYTNRKGTTYTLCQGVTKSGKPRYYFARQPTGEPVEELPAGYAIVENVNGQVSLARQASRLIRPEEVRAVETLLARHPKAARYRVNVKGDRIEVCELSGPDATELAAALSKSGFRTPRAVEVLQGLQDDRGTFSPVLGFVLADRTARTFGVERQAYRGDSWVKVSVTESLDRVARRWVPRLGTAKFYEFD